jgi:hypothetical protein
MRLYTEEETKRKLHHATTKYLHSSNLSITPRPQVIQVTRSSTLTHQRPRDPLPRQISSNRALLRSEVLRLGTPRSQKIKSIFVFVVCGRLFNDVEAED